MTKTEVKIFLKILFITTLVIDVAAVIYFLPLEHSAAGYGFIFLLIIGTLGNSILTTILTKWRIRHLDFGQMVLVWLSTFVITGIVLYITLPLTWLL